VPREENFSILYKTKAKLPRLAFCDMKNAVLGKNYELSLVIVGDALSQKINRTYRSLDKPTDILSFPLSKTSGEIFLNLKQAKLEAKKFDRSYENFIAFLFIHGLMHLKGFDHSSRMESEEVTFRKKFGI
jgi:probable rRNA maturation factor